MSHHFGLKETTVHRLVMMAASITLIVQTMSVDDPLGWRVIFPLVAIYPGIVALVGRKLKSSKTKLSTGGNRPKIGYSNLVTRG